MEEISTTAIKSMAATAESNLVAMHSHSDVHHAQALTEEEIKPKPRRYFDTTIRWLLLAYVFILPLWFLPFTFDIIEFNKQFLTIVFACVTGALFLIDTIRTGELPYMPGRFAKLAAGILGLSLIGLIFSVVSMRSVFGFAESRTSSLVTIASFVTLFYLLNIFCRTYRKQVLFLLQGSFVLVFLITIAQIFGWAIYRDLSQSLIVPNTIGASSIVILLGVILLPLFASQSLIKHPRFRLAENIIKIIGICALGLLLLVANAWQFWLAAVIATGAYGFLRRSEISHDRWRVVMMPAIVAAMALFFLITNINVAQTLKNRVLFYITPSYTDSYKVAWQALRTRPLGFGSENYLIAFDRLRPEASTLHYLDSASEFTSLVVEGGLLFLIGFIWLAWVLLVVIRKDNADDQSPAVRAALLGLLVSFFILPLPMTAIFLATVMGSMAGLASAKIFSFESNAKFSLYGSVGFVAGLVLIAITLFFTTRLYVANARYLLGTLAFGQGQRAQAFEFYGNSILSNPYDIRVHQSLAVGLLADVRNQLQSKPQSPTEQNQIRLKIQNQLDLAMRTVYTATKVSPADAQTWLAAGYINQNLIALGVAKAQEEALKMYTEAKKRDPKNPVIYARTGTIYLAVADIDAKLLSDNSQSRSKEEIRNEIKQYLSKAETEFKEAIGLRSDYAFAIYNLAVVYERQGRTAEMIREFEKLATSNKNDLGLQFQLALLYYNVNKIDAASNALKQVLAIAPDYANAHWYLSRIYEERGDLKAALEEVQIVAKTNPDNPEVKQRINSLKKGQRTVGPGGALNELPLDR